MHSSRLIVHKELSEQTKDIVTGYCKNKGLYFREAISINCDAVLYRINNAEIAFSGLELRQNSNNLLEHVHNKLNGALRNVA